MSGDNTAAPPPIASGREYVTLVSAEGYEFVLEKGAAMTSNTLRAMMAGSETIGRTLRRFPFDDISAPVMDLLCQYLAERHKKGASMCEFPQLNSLDPHSEEDTAIVCLVLFCSFYFQCRKSCDNCDRKVTKAMRAHFFFSDVNHEMDCRTTVQPVM